MHLYCFVGYIIQPSLKQHLQINCTALSVNHMIPTYFWYLSARRGAGVIFSALIYEHDDYSHYTTFFFTIYVVGRQHTCIKYIIDLISTCLSISLFTVLTSLCTLFTFLLYSCYVHSVSCQNSFGFVEEVSYYLHFVCNLRHIQVIFSGQMNIEICHPFILLRRNWYLTLT